MEANKAGKTTITNFWKSKSSKESKAVQLQSSIEVNQQEVEDFKKLVNFLTIYHGQIAVPSFKVSKAKLYKKLLNTFCMKEIANAHLSATLFHSLLEVEKTTGGEVEVMDKNDE